MQASLTDRVREGVSVSALSVALTQALALARSVVLARLLAPGDFGLFGMALTVTGALAVLTSFGLDTAIVARDFQDERELSLHLDTVWTAEIVRKALLALLLVAAAYPTARFYGSAELVPVLCALAAAPVIQSFQNIGLLRHQKRVEFRRLVLLEQLTNVSATLAAVAVAFWTRDVWALVWSQLLSATAAVLISYALDSYRPRPRFDRAALRQALGFGKWMFVVGVTAYVTTTADNVVVGRMLGAAALGVYVLAYNLASMPVEAVARTIGGVLFPAYVEAGAREGDNKLRDGVGLIHNDGAPVRDANARLEGALARTFTATAALLTVVAVLLVLLADDAVRLLYGMKWAGAAPVLRVLALVCFSRGLLQTLAPFVVSARGPRLEARAKLFESALFLAALYPLTLAYGLTGAAWAGACVYAIALVVRLWLVRLCAPRATGGLVRTLLRSLAAGAFGVVAGSHAATLVASPPARLLAAGLASTAAILLLLLSSQPQLRAEASGFGTWLLGHLPARERRMRRHAD